MDSLISLFSNDHKTGVEKRFKPVRKIFKLAGIIREEYLCVKFQEQLDIPVEDMEGRSFADPKILKFCSKQKIFKNSINKSRKKIAELIQTIEPSHVSAFFNNELNKAFHFISRQNFDNDLHTCRKKIKNLINNRTLAEKKFHIILSMDFEYLDTVQEMIGKWHDAKLAAGVFKKRKFGKKKIRSLKLRVRKLEQNLHLLSSHFWMKATMQISAK